jgi:hypothetical protein
MTNAAHSVRLPGSDQRTKGRLILQRIAAMQGFFGLGHALVLQHRSNQDASVDSCDAVYVYVMIARPRIRPCSKSSTASLICSSGYRRVTNSSNFSLPSRYQRTNNGKSRSGRQSPPLVRVKLRLPMNRLVSRIALEPGGVMPMSKAVLPRLRPENPILAARRV